jgi:hypothetical protein
MRIIVCGTTQRVVRYRFHPGCRGSFHIGDPASAMQRIRLQPPSPGDRTTRQAVLLSSAAGSLQLLAPLALPADSSLDMPAALAALRALQRELLLLLPQAAGLNPGAFRWGCWPGLAQQSLCASCPCLCT